MLVELRFTSGRPLRRRGLRPLSCDVRALRVTSGLFTRSLIWMRTGALEWLASCRSLEFVALKHRCQSDEAGRDSAVGAKKFRVSTTDSKHDLPIAANLLKQDFSATAINSVLAYGFHVHSSLRRLFVPMRCRRPLLAPYCWLGNQPTDRYQAGPGRVRSSDSSQAATRWADRPQRSWIAIRKPGVSPEARKTFVQAKHES